MTDQTSLDRPHEHPVDVVFELLNTTPVARGFNARYGVAIGLVLIAFCMRYVFSDDLLHRLPFIFFVPATVIAAWYGGLGAGIAAMVLGLLLGDYFFLAPNHAWGPLTSTAALAILVYAFTCLVGIVAIELLHIAIWKLKKENEQLRRELAVRKPGGNPPSA